MKSWKENQVLGAVVLAAAVLAGTFGIGGAKLSAAVSKTSDSYEEMIAGDLAQRAAAAQTIAEVGKAALGEESESVQLVYRALSALDQAQTPAQDFAADTGLTSAVGMLYEEVRKTTGEQKGSVLQTQWSEFLSRGNIIANTAAEYNEQARKTEKKLSGFPAGLIAKLAGLKAEPFADADVQ